jgi:hypothetical protein
MKRKGHISQTYIKRDRIALPELYRRAKRLATYPTSAMNIYRIMATLPTDRFYISDDAALFYMRKIFFHNITPTFRTPERRRLYEALRREVDNMMKEEKYQELGLNTTTILALMRPAPCVGLSAEAIAKIKWRKHQYTND